MEPYTHGAVKQQPIEETVVVKHSDPLDDTVYQGRRDLELYIRGQEEEITLDRRGATSTGLAVGITGLAVAAVIDGGIGLHKALHS
jgi:hypothetical protein